MHTNQHKILLFVVVFILSYLIFYPTLFFSVDELSYVSRSIAFSKGLNNWIQITIYGNEFSWSPADYPLGTAFLLSPMAWLWPKGIFLSGMLYVIISLFFIYRTLQSLDKISVLPFIVFFLFPPTVYFARGVMSEMPSLALLSFYLYAYINWSSSWKKFLLLGLLAGLSLLLRETNIIICGGLVLLPCIKNLKYFTAYSTGVLLGVVPRFLTGTYFYSNGIYVKKAATFDVLAIFHNLPLYLTILLILLPGGIFALYKLKGKFAKSIQLSLGLFILLHLFYTYHSGDHSGSLVSIFYNGRYFIPTLPLWCLVYAEYVKQNKFLENKNFVNILSVCCIIFLISFHGFLNYLGSKHEAVADDIFENYNDKAIIYHNAAYRYLNPLQGKINSLTLEKEVAQLNEAAYYILSHRNKTKSQKRQLSSQINKIKISKKLINTYQIFDGTTILVYLVMPNE